MTNYNTVVPGMQGGGGQTIINQQGGASTRTDGNYQDPSGTRVTGMDGGTFQDQVAGKPLVGFLVSVSKTEEGEYWVLRQGQNNIGSGSNCNIILPEASVSGNHAVLAVHRNPNDGNKINVGIIDKGSSNGVFVNDQYIGFNPFQCKNFDKIKIGNYELLLVLIDAVEFNMKKADNFVPKDDFDYSDKDMYTSMDGTRY